MSYLEDIPANMLGNICTVDEFVQHAYDFIICGGGTAGSVLAARLSELPNVMVGVIEAGGNSLEDLNILTPLMFPALLSNPQYDWMYTSSPQVRISIQFNPRSSR